VKPRNLLRPYIHCPNTHAKVFHLYSESPRFKFYQFSWFTSHQVDASMYLQIRGILAFHNPRWLPHFVRHYTTADALCNKRLNQCKHVKEVISTFPVLASNLNDTKPSCHSAVKDFVASPFRQKPGHLTTLLDYDRNNLHICNSNGCRTSLR
jgi:hypothetical protein